MATSVPSTSGVKRVLVHQFDARTLRALDDNEFRNIECRERAERVQREEDRKKSKYRFLDVPVAKLASGHTIPLIGLGTWKSAKGEVREAVERAVECGYRHIDCAECYGNEHEVGDALKAIFDAGVVKREDVFITSKLWNTNHSRRLVRSACMKSLKQLKLDYLDLYLMHWPVTGNRGDSVQPPIQETWEGMEALVDEGLVRSIGVSNFSQKKLKGILSCCRIKPSVNQVEVHPFFRNDALIAWCKRKGIHVTAFSPLGSPDSANLLKRQVTPNLLQDPRVLAIAKTYERNAGQVLIRWALQHGTSVLPKSVRPERIKTNLDVLDWELGEADVHQLSSFKCQVRMVDGSFWLSPSGPYRSLADLWDDPQEDTRLQSYMESQYDTKNVAPSVVLNSGHSMPIVGLGTWRSDEGVVRQAVIDAVRCGYRHIDCAEVYKNEAEVGEALELIFAEGVVKREDLFITSKLWNAEHAKDRVEPAARNTLKNLRIQYLDLYLIHWPVTGNVGPTLEPSSEETWAAMESLVDKGLVRSIGVSNFSPKKTASIISAARIKPAVNQVEIHPYFRNDALMKFCSENGVHVTAYSPLGGAPENQSLATKPLPKLLQDPILLGIAEKVNKSPAQVLIRWAIEHGTSVLPKSSKPSRIKANLDVLNWRLDDEDNATLSNLEPQMRMLDGNFFVNPQGPYKRIEDIWDD